MKVTLLNLAAIALSLSLSIALAYRVAPDASASASSRAATAGPTRIVSASGVADQVLAEIAEPGRVVAISAAASGPAVWRFEGAERIHRLSDVEAILALQPDVVFSSALGGDRSVARLREAGVEVVELGALNGFASLPDQIAVIGERIGEPERAAAFAARLNERMQSLRDRPVLARGLYLSVHGTQLYGGTQGSSFSDLLAGGGVDDVAAEAGHHGWPDYTSEDLLRMDPPLLVMPEGHPDELCRLAALDQLQACRAGAFVTLDADLLNDPGPRLVDAAAALRAAIEARASE